MMKVSEPKRPLNLEMTNRAVCGAERDSACNCAVARGLKQQFGSELLECHVMNTITTLFWSGGVVHRYQTPELLRAAIGHFDATGKWDLEPGTYQLKPLPRSQTCRAQRQRAAQRRSGGDSNMSKKYPYSGRCRKRSINKRVMNLKALQSSIASTVN